MNTLLVGADPELFIKRRGIFYGAADVRLPGTKKQPYKVTNGAVQVDGMAAEFNIDPGVDEKMFVGNINSVMKTLRKLIPVEYELAIEPVAEFEEKYMEQQPQFTKELGCDPDFNAYDGAPNPRPDQHPTMRTAAGHIHLGWTGNQEINKYEHFVSCCTLTKQLDFFLGLPSVIMDPDTKRKEMYGKAGAFRPKPYGLEYRVLSNFWLQSDKLKKWVYNNTVGAFELLAKDGIILSDKYGDVCQNIINNNEKKAAEELCKELGINYF